MLEDLYARREELIEEMKDSEGLDRVRLMTALESIDQVLQDPRRVIDGGPFQTSDPLVNEWEQDVAAGRTPDLYKNLPKGSLVNRRRGMKERSRG